MDIAGRLSSSLADRYQIERELGQGGMAVVYLAQDLRHDRKVALKVLRPELAAILGGERFLQEIRTTANLQHPHILPLHDSGEVDGIVYYVMPYIDGESLRDRIHREKQLPVDDAVRIAREVAGALDYAHRHSVVHRDIKPENILLHDGQALVADFGIALAVSTVGGGTRMTETGMSLGTPHYMAPEQAMGDREITPRADIYALGCVTYEMLTGEPPFTGTTAQAIVARVVTEQPRSMTVQRRTIPPNVEAAVIRSLEKLPADRFASAAQFAEALSRADFAPAVPRATPAAARRGLRPLVLASLPWVLVLFASGAGAWSWMRREPPPVSRQRILLRDMPFSPGSLSRGVAIAPNDGAIVFTDTSGGQRHLYLKEQDRLEAVLLAGTAGAWGPAFSLDGAWIAFFADGRLKKVPRLGGSAITMADSANPTYHGIAWLDNDSVAYNDLRFALRLVHADGGPSRLVAGVDSLGRGVVTIGALPGGRAVLIGTCSPGCQGVDTRVVDLRTGKATVLSADVVRAWHTADGDLVLARIDGGLFRARFDLEQLKLTTAPVPVLDGIRTTPGRVDVLVGGDGTLLYVAGAAAAEGVNSEVVMVDRTGRAVPVSGGWLFTRPGNYGMAPSPDGRRLALTIRANGTDDIWIKDLVGGQLTRLTFAGMNVRPEWSADGRYVMFASRAVTGASDDVLRRRADGTGSTDTIVNLSRGIYEFRRLRDTTRLIVRLGGAPTRDIALARIGDTAATMLVAQAGHEEVQPDLSPDGRWLAYASNESGRNEIYVRPFPEVDAGRWQVSRNGGGEPRWSPDGRELFFLSADRNLMSVPVTARTSLATGEPRVLFSAQSFAMNAVGTHWAVMPDGRRFVFVRDVGGSATPGPSVPTAIVRVEHWLAELRLAERR